MGASFLSVLGHRSVCSSQEPPSALCRVSPGAPAQRTPLTRTLCSTSPWRPVQYAVLHPTQRALQMGVFAPPLLWLQEALGCLLNEHRLSYLHVSCYQLEKKKELSGKFQVNTRNWGVLIQALTPIPAGRGPLPGPTRLCWAEDSRRFSLPQGPQAKGPAAPLVGWCAPPLHLGCSNNLL